MLTDEQMQKLGVKDYDMADYLKSEKECEEYLNAALDENDPEFFVHALGVVARAKGMMEIAKKTGCSRTSLYKALSKNSRPEFKTVYNVIKELGYTICKKPKRKKAYA